MLDLKNPIKTNNITNTQQKKTLTNKFKYFQQKYITYILIFKEGKWIKWFKWGDN